ncbi:MAG: hypothetical protein E7402_02395 [Ruminococcaceae bacterium]|nr:hypothetical protein [Oscillospiraceae bacterium]
MKLPISALYKEIYKRFDELTPIPYDCGAMCGKLCCQGDDESGMYLFPGEKSLFVGKENFSVLETEFSAGGKSVELLVCHGPCKREERPLSCRIFPLIPLYRKGSTLEIILDPRASFCPLTHPEVAGYLDERFIRELNYCFSVLVKIPAVAEFLDALSYILEDYGKLDDVLSV